jgi:hypothetical protein
MLVLFRGRNILGGGEAGAAFYDLFRVYAMNKMAWSDIFLGMNSGLTSVSNPTFGFLAFLQALGISGYIIQAGFFLIILFLGLYSMYKLTSELFPKASLIAWVFSALFYQFNLFSIANIWNRFLPNVMFFYSVLPLALWLCVRGLKMRRYLYAVLVSFLTVVFAYAFSAPAQIMIYWGIISFTFLYYYFYISKDRFVIKFFLITFLLWATFNFWWIFQELQYYFSTTFLVASESFFDQTGNLSTFFTLSNLLGKLSNIFLLKHGTFFIYSEDFPFNWPLIFSHPLALMVGWFLFVATVIISIRRRGDKWIAFLLTLFVLGVLGSKGNSPPLGELFELGFKKVSLLSFFRNPFEKLGIILTLAFSPLFGLAVDEILILTKSKKKLRIVFKALFLTCALVFIGFPFWTGLVFTSGSPPANDPAIGIQVDIPEFYQEANQWLSGQSGEFRYISLPLGPGEGIYYQWPKGYVGLEQSSLLFSNPGVSHVTTIPYYVDVAGDLERIFIKYPDFYKTAAFLNAKYLVLRPEIDFKLSGMRNPEEIKTILQDRISNSDANLSFAKSFGPLEFYEFSEDVLLPKIYAASGIVNSNTNGRLDDIYIAGNDKKDVVISSQTKEHASLSQKESTLIVGNIELFEIVGPEYPVYTEAPYIFPYVRHLPSSKFYQAILFKERLERAVKINQESKISWDILMLGKRLIEVKMSLQQGDIDSAKKALDIYQEKLPRITSDIEVLSRSLKKPEERVWREKELVETFLGHLYSLKQFEATSLNENDYVTLIIDEFNKEVSKTKALPFWNLLENEDFPIRNRIIYQLEFANAGEYEILIPKTKFFAESFDLKDEVFLQIDDRIEKRKLVTKEDNVSFGNAVFSKGLHEIGLNQSPIVNLSVHDDFILESKTKKQELIIPISDFDAYTQYNISFDYWVKYGDALSFSVNHNTDKAASDKDGEIEYYFNKRLAPDSYWFDQKSFATVFNPNPKADSADLVFTVSPWNNCEELFVKDRDKCLDLGFRKQYDKPTYVSVLNLRVTPKFPRTLFLLNEKENKLSTPEIVTFDKINATRYKVSVKGAKEPFLLVFSELHDSGWKVYFRDGISAERRDKIWETWDQPYLSDDNHFLVNGYANSWWIDQTGDFEMILDFFPQRFLYVGYLVSGVSCFLGLFYLVFVGVKTKFKKGRTK